MFEVRADSDRKLLVEERDSVFHSAVDQLLFVTPRSKKDIQTYSVLLTTIVRDTVLYY